MLAAMGPWLLIKSIMVHLMFNGRACTDAELLNKHAAFESGVYLARGVLGESELARLRNYMLERMGPVGNVSDRRYWCGVSDEYGGDRMRESAMCLLKGDAREKVPEVWTAISARLSRLPGTTADGALADMTSL